MTQRRALRFNGEVSIVLPAASPRIVTAATTSDGELDAAGVVTGPALLETILTHRRMTAYEDFQL